MRVIGEGRHGRSALRAIDTWKALLVCLDVQMPDLDGFGVSRAGGVAAEGTWAEVRANARGGSEATLEDVFLELVGAPEEAGLPAKQA